MGKIETMKAISRLLTCVFLPVVLTALLAGCFVLPEEEKVLGPPVMKPPEVDYNLVEAQRKDISRQVYLYGHLVPVLDRELFFRYQGGRVTNIYVKYGDTVRKGQLLAQLDLGNLQNQLEQRKIGLTKSQLRYDTQKASNASKIDLQMAELDIRLAQLQLDDIEARIADARLVSPMNGTIVDIGAKEGEFVSAFQPLIRVVDPTDLILECEAGKDSDYFYTGMDVEVIIKGQTAVGASSAVPGMRL